jgi:hypothetical protein
VYFESKVVASKEASRVSEHQPFLSFMTDDISDRKRLVARWTELVKNTLPSMAQRHQWPVNEDHCFMRICLDSALGAPWHTVVKHPAIRHLSNHQLTTAIAVAEGVVCHPKTLHALNRQSISWRKNADFRP